MIVYILLLMIGFGLGAFVVWKFKPEAEIDTDMAMDYLHSKGYYIQLRNFTGDKK